MRSTLILVFGFAIATTATLSIAANTSTDAVTAPNNDAGISSPATNAPALKTPQNVDSQQVSGTSAAILQKLDKNKDAYIDLSEAQESSQLKSDFKTVDTNKDGRISLDELRNYQSK